MDSKKEDMDADEWIYVYNSCISGVKRCGNGLDDMSLPYKIKSKNSYLYKQGGDHILIYDDDYDKYFPYRREKLKCMLVDIDVIAYICANHANNYKNMLWYYFRYCYYKYLHEQQDDCPCMINIKSKDLERVKMLLDAVQISYKIS